MKQQEIERKFLVTGDGWRGLGDGVLYRQGYIARTQDRTVRVRVAGEKGYLTIKYRGEGIARSEFEYDIPLEEAQALLDGLAPGEIIEKLRHTFEYEGSVWEVDEFLGANRGLIVAEIELDAEDQVDELEAELEELKDMGDEYREDISNLQQAISDAQAAGEDTTALEEELAALEEEYQDYKDNLSDNQRDLEKRIASAKSTRDSAQLKYEIAVNGMSLDQYNAQVEMETALGYEETAQTLYEIEIARLANTVASKELALEKLADQIEDLEAYLTDGQVKATYAGLVMNVNVVAGDKVSANDTLATIANEENVYIGLAIDQEDIGDITLGKEANVYFDAYPDEKFTGVVDSMSVTPAMSASSTVSYNIQVKLSGDTNKLYQGMTGTVTFITKEVQDVIMVSNRAVFTENGKSYVKIKNDDGSISTVEVETGFSNGNMVEIISGLEEGQTALIESKVNS